MARSIKISDQEMEFVRREAELSSRSVAGQVSHWMRIGRAIEQSRHFSYAQVRSALAGTISPDDLTGEEQEVFVDELMHTTSTPTLEQNAFFRDRRRKGKGVGTGDDGQIVRQASKKSS